MVEEGPAAVSIPTASLQKNTSPLFSSIRFLGLLKQPDSDPYPNDHLELEESDVFWPADLSDDFSSAVHLVGPYTSEADPSIGYDLSSYSPSVDRRRAERPFLAERFGLSAALAEDRRSLVRAIDPSRSATTAVQIIPPVPVARSGSEVGSGGFGKIVHQSAPVNVPAWPRGRRKGFEPLDEVEDGEKGREEEEEDDDEMLPPHVIVARSHMMTFSVFEGVGRTLKGRDLRRVRNAVWQKTGFLN